MMHDDELARDGVFDPPTLKLAGNAVDEAWAELAGDCPHGSADAMRLRLATAVLDLVKSGVRDPARLEAVALETMQS